MPFANCDLSDRVVEDLRRTPVHAALQELGRAATEMDLAGTAAFKKLLSYLLELADGRDRREPWAQRPGVARPVPKLRVAIDACFGEYGDLQWFRLNKIANGSGRPLVGLFPRMAASVARLSPDHVSELARALVSGSPDSALLSLLHTHDGRIPHAGLELFSRLAYAFRPGLYFVIPRAWGDSSGCARFVGGDLRKYCALCRKLRDVCDAVGIDPEIRGSVFTRALTSTPVHAALQAELNRVIGPSLIRFTALGPLDAYEVPADEDQFAAMPMDFAARSIRARRGERRLRSALLKTYGDRCAITGDCPRDLLEVAHIVPFPKPGLPTVSNALLLRSDLHTLWDLNLIAIEPTSLQVRVADRLGETSYQKLAGRRVIDRVSGSSVSIPSLKERWATFNADRFSEKLVAAPAARRPREETKTPAPQPSRTPSPGPEVRPTIPRVDVRVPARGEGRNAASEQMH